MDEINYANKEMDEAKKGIAENEEKKAVAEGDLDVKGLISALIERSTEKAFCDKELSETKTKKADLN